jgi:glycosyltransferase involved in cell wall biosynthesis
MKIDDWPNKPNRALELSNRYQAWLAELHLDLYHAATPYQLDELVLTEIDVCPVVATMYDLIPVVYADLYWPPGAPFHEELHRALAFMRRADRLIAISESARNDAHQYLGVPLAQIDLAYPFPDPMFRVLPADQAATMLRKLRERLAIPETFLVSLIHIHHSKNPENLLAAYGRLPEAVREGVPLVIIFFLRDSDRFLLDGWMAKYGVKNNIILTGLVSDDELVALYNAATIVVHPSRYEGFGLPVVEAMACGAPVITTTAASLPEAGGDAAVLVDPDDVQGLANAIASLLDDPARRAEMSRRSLEHVQRFNAEELGRQTLASYSRAIAASASTPDTAAQPRPRVALWSSMPPLNCGIADYTVELMDALNTSCELEIFVDHGYLPTNALLHQYHIYDHAAFERRQSQRPFDAIVYQLGVSTMHDYMYEAIRKHPGIVVIHDVNFAQGFHHVYEYQRNRLDDFKRMIVAVEGADALSAFEQAHALSGSARDAALQAFYDRYLLLHWVVDHSLAQVVHMQYAKQMLEERYPNANVFYVDHGAADPWAGMAPFQIARVRAQLRLPISTLIVGIFGSIVPLKRIEASVHAFHTLIRTHPDSMLLFVGEAYDSEYTERIKKLCADLGIMDKVRFIRRPERRVFDAYLLAIDILVNLRYPSRQQMSGVLIRAIASGKPVIVSDLPEWRYFPESFCIRVAPDTHEIEALTSHLERLAADPALRRTMSQAARSFFEQQGSKRHIEAQYLEVIQTAVTGLLETP